MLIFNVIFLMTYVDIVINLHYEGYTAVNIYHKLVELFKDKAPAYSTVTKKIRALSFSDVLDEKDKLTFEKINYQISFKISELLDWFPNASVRFISSHINIPSTTVYRYLTEVLHYKCFHLRWIPHPITENLRQKRIEFSKLLLNEILIAKKNSFKFFVTGDESWFMYEYTPRTQWIKPGDKPPNRISKSLLIQKIMITIFWSKSGIQVLDALDQGNKMNSAYFIEKVLKPLTRSKLYLQAKKQKQKYILHMDNSKVHRSSETTQFLASHSISIAPHPVYSPDLAGSDFFLFGALKGNNQNLEFTSPDEILSYINEKFSTFSEETLNNVFLEWENRLRWVIDHNGDCFQRA